MITNDKDQDQKVCRTCGETYERTYEEHTGSQKHRDAIWKAVGREGYPPPPVR